ncbi:hypothetical protein ACFLQ8_03100 [Candidatus Auribacterota bacterium]
MFSVALAGKRLRKERNIVESRMRLFFMTVIIASLDMGTKRLYFSNGRVFIGIIGPEFK